jgi:hypothetical protein
MKARICAACGANQDHNLIRCEQCGQPLVFPASFVCPRCGAESFNQGDIVNRYCGRCHVFIDDWPRPAPEAYIDESFDERACDFCGKLYRGPAVYCSLECATDDL